MRARREESEDPEFADSVQSLDKPRAETAEYSDSASESEEDEEEGEDEKARIHTSQAETLSNSP